MEPYPKSKALELHDDSIEIKRYCKNVSKVVFETFIGIGPRRFIDLFSIKLSNGVKIIREQSGKTVKWSEKESIFRFPLVSMSYLDKEISIGAKIKQGEKMTKRKERTKYNNSFWDTTSDNYDKVQEWPKWKQSITISSSTANTGRFIESKSTQRSEK